MTPRAAAACLALTAPLAGWGLSALSRPVRPRPGAPVVAPPGWPAQAAAVYDLTYLAESKADFGAPLAGRLALVGRLHVQASGPGHLWVGLAEVSALALQAGGGRFADREALAAARCEVELASVGVRCSAATSPVARHILEAVSRDLLGPPSAPGPATTSLAEGPFTWRTTPDGRVGERGDPDRTRLHPDGGPATGHARFTLEASGGQVTRLALIEEVAAGAETRGRVQAEAILVGHAPPAPLELVEAAPPPHRPTPPTVTLAEVLADLRTYGPGGALPDHARWLARTAALLRARPDLCDAFAEAGLAADQTDAGRRLVADVLANVGHAAAQAGLRRLLREGPATSPAERARLIQSYLLVPAPDAASVELLTALADADEPGRLAAANVLGVAARVAAEGGDAAGAEALRADLTRRLATARDAGEVRAYATALGNAGGRTDALIPLAGADDAATRQAAARALRRDAAEPAARAALFGLVHDDDPGVQRAALAALAATPLSVEDVEEIQELVEAGALAEAAVPALLGALPGLPRTRRRALVEALLAVVQDPRLRARLAAVQGEAG
ncbi:MAG: HEAT repeat domain-containing protein [bacterium]